jgi:1-acyl-sn-glycerol-3-phosphate acyltransferase
MYPEGTRSTTGELGSFKKGAFHLAIDAKVDVVPVHIKGTFDVWSKNSNKITPGDITVKIGKPISSANYDKRTIRDFVSEAKISIEKMGE